MSESRDLLLQGGALPTHLLERLLDATGALRAVPRPPQTTRFVDARRTAAFDALIPRIEAERLDWAFMPQGKTLEDFRLIAFDMDSTLITIECIDELADFAGKKREVAAATAAAMRGEIDYSESLRQRLALLEGLDVRILARVYEERLRLSPGARALLDAAREANLKTALISGGFTYFTERLRIELGFDFATSNELEISGGKITGRVIGAIIDAQAKARHLRAFQEKLGLERTQVIAVGDGANDLLMMSESGLSVAYHAKPATRAKADAAITFSGLDSILNLLAP
ncbi:MAG: phosphoserine phosphatase SerB [Zoogloeaceae bacterium]|jgi:phosphoserine phosphatase|nr:phosphoserine phosphatase SerB [Zoogloeaceae bacterium]